MRKLILISALVFSNAFAVGSDDFATVHSREATRQARQWEKEANDILKAREVARRMIIERSGDKPKKTPAVMNAFLEECEALTMNRKMCNELYEERYANQ